MAEALLRHAATIAGFYPPHEPMAGYVVVGWGQDGSFTRGLRFHGQSPVKYTMLPSFIADIVRRDMVRDVIDEAVFNRDPEG